MSSASARTAGSVRRELSRLGKRSVAKNYERYFKGVVRFRGVKGPVLKRFFPPFYKKTVGPLSFDNRFAAFEELIASPYSEDKGFGIAILTRDLKRLGRPHLRKFAGIIDRHIGDWGTCDGLSGKVISRMLKRDPALAEAIRPWKNARGIWRKRASCVSFVNIARFGRFDSIILDVTSTCLRSRERFVQLGVGWALRELSLADRPRVVRFIKSRYADFSREGLRYAIEKMPPRLRRELLAHGKARA